MYSPLRACTSAQWYIEDNSGDLISEKRVQEREKGRDVFSLSQLPFLRERWYLLPIPWELKISEMSMLFHIYGVVRNVDNA